MPTTTKVFYRGAAATSSTTLYTAPDTSTTAVVTNIAITNLTTSGVTATINLDAVAILSSVAIPASTTTFIDLKQVIPANNPAKTISGLASSTSVNFHISGVEIS